jgi:serine/threonine protein kinase
MERTTMGDESADQSTWCGHSALKYDEIESAGPPVRPLDFPTPKVHRAAFVSALGRDHTTGRTSELQRLLVRLPHQRWHASDTNRGYLLKKKLSKSTYGSVRLGVVLRKRCREDVEADGVEWESTDELVAVKASSWQKIRQCRGKHMEDPIKEVAALQYTGNYHPNVLGCLEVLQDDNYLYTVMPYCTGGDLYSNIMAGQVLSNLEKPIRSTVRRPSEEQARVWFGQLLQGLFHMQKKGISHRDLSLENLLLDEYGDLVIADLGLALRVPFLDASNPGCVSDVSEGSQRLLIQAQGQCGDLCYMAPEVLQRDDAFDGFALDLWSSGIILFIILVGRAPFKWAHSTDVRYSLIARGRFAELMRDLDIPLSCEACHLMQNMLLRDPRERLSLAQVMNHPWVVGTKSLGPVVPEPNTTHGNTWPMNVPYHRSTLNAHYKPPLDPSSFQKSLNTASCQPSRLKLERFASF